MSEIHALISSSKALLTWTARDAIQEAREACGGHVSIKSDDSSSHSKLCIDLTLTSHRIHAGEPFQILVDIKYKILVDRRKIGANGATSISCYLDAKKCPLKWRNDTEVAWLEHRIGARFPMSYLNVPTLGNGLIEIFCSDYRAIIRQQIWVNFETIMIHVAHMKAIIMFWASRRQIGWFDSGIMELRIHQGQLSSS